MKNLIDNIKKTEHGFKHIIESGNIILDNKKENHFELAKDLLSDKSYQVRMLATYLLGRLSAENPKARKLLEARVAEDKDWRVQEMLAKAFDHYCQMKGYENSLPTIKRWLAGKNPNVRRAVIEGLRIWTSRPYFKENPKVAINLISAHREEENEYLRKSVGNSLRDIRKKHKDLVDEETLSWNINEPRVKFVKNLVEK